MLALAEQEDLVKQRFGTDLKRVQQLWMARTERIQQGGHLQKDSMLQLIKYLQIIPGELEGPWKNTASDIMKIVRKTDKFYRQQAKESLMHADMVGEHITGLEGHPPLNTGNIKETHKHNITDILEETLDHERSAIKMYYKLLQLVQDKSVYLEEFARTMIGQEELHVLEVEKMLKEQR